MKSILKDSWRFYRAHWAKLVLLLLPIAAIVFMLSLLLRFGLTPPKFFWVSVIGLLVALAIILAKVFKIIVIFAVTNSIDDFEKGVRFNLIAQYENFWRKTPQMLWILVLGLLFMIAVAFLALLGLVIIIVLPFVIFSFLIKLSPALLTLLNTEGGIISTAAFALALLFFLGVNLFALGRVWLGPLVFALEGRRGLDALAESACLTRQKRWQAPWTIISILSIAFTPAFIILAPVCYKIFLESRLPLAIGAMLYAQYGTIPALPRISDTLFFWRELSLAIVCLVSAPIFATLNYFFWRESKKHAHAFDKKVYEKSRKRFKALTIFGFFIMLMASILYVFGG